MKVLHTLESLSNVICTLICDGLSLTLQQRDFSFSPPKGPRWHRKTPPEPSGEISLNKQAYPVIIKCYRCRNCGNRVEVNVFTGDELQEAKRRNQLV